MVFSRILAGHDGRPHGEDAAALGHLLSSATGAKLILARVVAWEPLALQAVPLPERKQRYEHEERAALAELQEAADRIGADAEPGPGSSPAQGLHLLAEELQPDLVIVGSSHRGPIGQVLAGNVALRLLNGLDRPLAVAPAGYAGGNPKLRTIGVGFDGSEESRSALRMAGQLAQAAGAEVRIIAVALPPTELVPHPSAFAWGSGHARLDLETRLRGSVESAVGLVPAGVECSSEIQTGGPVAVLSHLARDLDLLVLGSRGYGPVRRVLLGSVSSELVRSAACPVLVVPRPAPASLEHRGSAQDATSA